MESHIPDQELLLYMDGELKSRAMRRVKAHLEQCWKCRARRMELDTSIYEFMHLHQTAKQQISSIDGPKAHLAARLDYQRTAIQDWQAARSTLQLLCIPAAVVCALLAVRFFWVVGHSSHTAASLPTSIVDSPNPKITPGATLLTDRQIVCSQPNIKNKEVSVAFRRRVFTEYGIANADPRQYEVDYLVTPALGGVDDIHNLWPHSYSGTVWNAHVKDDLEDRLRGMVCTGDLDLTRAQHDIASNWIGAYKRYFHTDKPLTER